MLLCPEDLWTALKRELTTSDALTRWNAPGLAAFLFILDRLEQDLVIDNASDLANYVRFKARIGFIVEVAKSPLSGPYDFEGVPLSDFSDLISIVKRHHIPGSSNAEDRLGTAFMGNHPLRPIVDEDFAALLVELKAGRYKAAIVSAGAVSEGLLAFVFIENPYLAGGNGTDGVPADKWSMDQLTYAARSHSVLTDASLEILKQIKESRNLIHPGRAITSNIKPSRGLAIVAHGAAVQVRDEVAAWIEKQQRSLLPTDRPEKASSTSPDEPA